VPDKRGLIRRLLSKIFETLLAKIAVALLLVGVPLDIATGWVTTYVLHPAAVVFQWTIEVLEAPIRTWHLLVVAIVWYLLWRVSKLPAPAGIPDGSESPFYFEDRGGLKWRVNRYTGRVDTKPYCKVHQVELARDWDFLVCPICKRENTDNLTIHGIGTHFDDVVRITAAKFGGHLKA
jgi:hypothetical protein